jgi:uncharacterized Zn-finger protein
LFGNNSQYNIPLDKRPLNGSLKGMPKIFACLYPGCEKIYTNKSRLEIHCRTHTGEKPFKCKECGKAFNEKGNLKIHMRIHTGEKPYKCTFDECRKEFKAYGHLSDHLKRHLNIRPFVCESCGASFSRRNTLKTHSMIHSGEKPFVCEFADCGKKFSEKGNLKTHIKTHEKFEKAAKDFAQIEQTLVKNLGLEKYNQLYSKLNESKTNTCESNLQEEVEKLYNKEITLKSSSAENNTLDDSCQNGSCKTVFSFYDIKSERSWYEKDNDCENYSDIFRYAEQKNDNNIISLFFEN